MVGDSEENDDCVMADEMIYIPEVKNEERPKVGMKFDSLDFVYDFYNRYALLVGFSIRRHSSGREKYSKEILRKEFVCCKQEGHNHTMTPPERVHFMRSHRHISEPTKLLTKQLGSADIPTHKKMSILEVQYGGMEKIGFTKKDIYNFEYYESDLMKNHDVELMQLLDEHMGFMEMLSCSIPHSTRTDMACHLHQCWGLITMEFKKAVPSGEPKMIITDQDAIMARAIFEVFPTTFHRLCIWHITTKFSDKLPRAAYEEYWKEFKETIWEIYNIDEFEEKWHAIVTKSGLTDHLWLSSVFDLRKSCVPAYVKHVFAAGMSSSQRAEGSHAFFKQYISRRNSLMDFITRF
ncbi:unnamed protein product [Prunus armeniaca]